MNKTELRHIAEDLVEELRELSDGTEITSAQLLKRTGYDPKELSQGGLFEYHEALFRTAKANHITLDMSKHENKTEGLPWNLDFVVRNKKAQIKCPHCGSIDTARIQYGMPAFTEEFQEKLAAGKVFLGGCCIDGSYTENGEWVSLDPARYCNHCKKAFAKPAYWRDHDRILSYVDEVEAVELQVGGFFSGTTAIRIKKNDKGALVHVDYLLFPAEFPPEDRQITSLRWNRLVNRLFNELYVHEWKKNYMENGPEITMDGTQWNLTISLAGRRVRTYKGSNAYPPYWNELKALFRPFGKIAE